MKIGVLMDCLGKTFEGAVDFATKVGAHGFQMYVGTPTFYVGMPNESKKYIKDYLTDRDLQISAICGDVGARMFYFPEEMRKEIDHQKKLVDIAYEMGVPVITTHIGVVPESKENKHYATMYNVYKELADYAGEANVRFAIETGPEPSSRLKSFLDDVNSKGSGVNLDPANLVMIQGENPVEAVHNLKDYIVHTHAKDGKIFKKVDSESLYVPDILGIPQGEAGTYIETPLGEGQVPWDEYLLALKEIGYDYFLTIERETGEKPEEDIALAVRFLTEKMKKNNI